MLLELLDIGDEEVAAGQQCLYLVLRTQVLLIAGAASLATGGLDQRSRLGLGRGARLIGLCGGRSDDLGRLLIGLGDARARASIADDCCWAASNARDTSVRYRRTSSGSNPFRVIRKVAWETSAGVSSMVRS